MFSCIIGSEVIRRGKKQRQERESQGERKRESAEERKKNKITSNEKNIMIFIIAVVVVDVVNVEGYRQREKKSCYEPASIRRWRADRQISSASAWLSEKVIRSYSRLLFQWQTNGRANSTGTRCRMRQWSSNGRSQFVSLFTEQHVHLFVPSLRNRKRWWTGVVFFFR